MRVQMYIDLRMLWRQSSSVPLNRFCLINAPRASTIVTIRSDWSENCADEQSSTNILSKTQLQYAFNFLLYVVRIGLV